MKALDRQLLRELADWSTGGLPVTSVYLDVDGEVETVQDVPGLTALGGIGALLRF